MDKRVEEKIKQWLEGNYDEDTKNKIKEMRKNDPDALQDAFYRDLEFGTGGLRGIMGPGTNRMNEYTVGIATQGFANYINKSFEGEICVAISHDSRNNSRYFAEVTANVMAANGIKVFLVQSLRPTPLLSFAIRYLKCQGGVMCTASHNPKEYNGYKAYWDDGAQLVPPHDKNVMEEVKKISDIGEVKWTGKQENIMQMGENVDNAFLEMLDNQSLYPDVVKKQHDLKIVYTSIHGTGITLVPQILERKGFTNTLIVEEQAKPDGDFPTVKYPNPEEPEAMSLGLKQAKEEDADILLGTDPDGDRVGIGVKDNHDKWVLLNGNQTAALLFNYIVESRKKLNLNKDNDYVCKTIVTTELIDAFAKHHHITCYNVLTGFKYIAGLIKEKEGKENFVCGGEESYGYMIGDKVRDKDAVGSVAMICEMAAYAKEEGKTLFDQLISLYVQNGFYMEQLISLTKKGQKGAEEIQEMMKKYRENPPKAINKSRVIAIYDYKKQEKQLLKDGKTEPINLPKSNVLQFITEDGSKISARPSGTEPKIKFYFSVKTQLEKAENYDKVKKELEGRIKAIIKDMKLED